MEERAPSNYIYALFSLRNKRIVTTVLERIMSDGINLQYDTAAKTDDDPSAKGSELLKDAKKAIVFISRAFSESQRCLTELSQLHDIEKSVVPIFLDCSSFPDYLSADAFWLLKSCAGIYCRNFNTTNLLSDKNFYSTIYKYTMDLQGVPAQEQAHPRTTPSKALASATAQGAPVRANSVAAGDGSSLGKNHTSKPVAAGNLAIADSKLGERQRAVEEQEKRYLLCSKELGEGHPDTLTTMSNLAYAYGELGEWEKKLELEERLYPLHRRVLGKEHPSTLKTMVNLAETYRQLGGWRAWKKKLELEERLYPLHRRVLGKEHPNTVETMFNLAHSYNVLGKEKKELELEERLYPLCCRVLGKEHPKTLTTMNNLAIAYGKTGNWQNVVELEEKLYLIYCQSSGEKSRVAKYHRNRLAEAYEKLGMVEKAHELQSEG